MHTAKAEILRCELSAKQKVLQLLNGPAVDVAVNLLQIYRWAAVLHLAANANLVYGSMEQQQQ